MSPYYPLGPDEVEAPERLRAEDLAHEAHSVYDILRRVMTAYGWQPDLYRETWVLKRKVEGTNLWEDQRITHALIVDAADREEHGDRGPLDYLHRHFCEWGQEHIVLLVRDAWALVPPLYRMSRLMSQGRTL